MWDIAESTTTMMAACIPSLRVLVRDVKESSANFHTNNLPYISPGLSKVMSMKSSENSGRVEPA